MRVRVEVRRVQVIEKWVRAADEAAALAKVRAEAAEPWGLGSWKTVDMNAEVMEIEGTEGITADGVAHGPMLLSVRDAATQLISHSSLYPLIQSGEIEHVKIGRRTLLSRDVLQTFIQANTRLGLRAGREMTSSEQPWVAVPVEDRVNYFVGAFAEPPAQQPESYGTASGSSTLVKESSSRNPAYVSFPPRSPPSTRTAS